MVESEKSDATGVHSIRATFKITEKDVERLHKLATGRHITHNHALRMAIATETWIAEQDVEGVEFFMKSPDEPGFRRIVLREEARLSKDPQ